MSGFAAGNSNGPGSQKAEMFGFCNVSVSVTRTWERGHLGRNLSEMEARAWSFYFLAPAAWRAADEPVSRGPIKPPALPRI
ncbi:MAG: hypothetical protein ACRD2B_15850 [Terriglobia bacterium]